MSESMPYLGSKISLISKSEIRYEGILYTIDAQDSIIALAKVQSFGTEDRPTEMPVPAKSDIYEYIIFRGTDIKKIEVCETPKQPLSGVHNDPAIVGLQVQQQPPSVGTSYPNTSSFGHQPLGPIGSGSSFYGGFAGGQLGQSAASSGYSIGVPQQQPSELTGGIGGVSVDPHSPSRTNQPIPTPIGAPPSHSSQDILSGSRSSTPSTARKSPVVDAGVQVSPQQRAPHPQPQKPRQVSYEHRKRTSNETVPPPRPLEQIVTEKPAARESRGGEYYNLSRRSDRDRPTTGGYYYNSGYGNAQAAPHPHPSPSHRHYQSNGYHQNYGQQQQQQYPGGYRGGATRGGRPARRPQARGGRGGYGQTGGPRRPDQIFDKEFDFETANEEFEELRTQLAKTKISENGAATAATTEEPSGAGATTATAASKDEKRDDSGHETATTGDESEDSNSASFYDKTKSFFDNISCEAAERSKGKSQRSDWRQERRINVQTFGMASARRGYFLRGRGGFYSSRGGAMHSGGGGGYGYRNYNQGGYYRNSNQSYHRGGGGYRSNNGNYSRRKVNGERDPPPATANDAVASSEDPAKTNGTGSYAAALRGAEAAAN